MKGWGEGRLGRNEVAIAGGLRASTRARARVQAQVRCAGGMIGAEI